MPSNGFAGQLRHAWDLFNNKDPSNIFGSTNTYGYGAGPISYARPGRHRMLPSTDATIATSIYARIAVDSAMYEFRHAKTDNNGNYLEDMNTGLNKILTVEANVDQSAKQFMLDLVLSVLDEGVVAVVPVETNLSLVNSNAFDILSARTAKIVGWFPQEVSVDIYNDKTGSHQQLRLPKSKVAIIENPFYSVMNEPNSTLKRLVRKLALLDAIDEQSGSGKLDLIIQLPYMVKHKTRKDQAETRRTELEEQLANSKYGIGYIDGTERITQLNRSVDNNLMAQVEYLASMLYSQLGITQEIMNGTASADAMANYYKRSIEPILEVITSEFSRKFLTKTARTQNQAILYYRNPFNLTTPTAMAEIADKFTRNEVLSPNEVRGAMGFRPSKDPKADELRNRNINQSGNDGGISDDSEESIWDLPINMEASI